MTTEDIAPQQHLLATHRQTLTLLLSQQAAQGGSVYAAPALINAINDARANIRAFKRSLRDGGVVVDDLPTDEAFSPADPPSRDTPLGTPAFLSRFGDGMGALRTLITQVPDIHDAAVRFRTLFQTTCEHVAVLRAYKGLHDLLHDLQLKCYEPLERERANFPDDDTVVATLETYALNLEDIITRLQELLADAPAITPHPAWISQLAHLHATMTMALNTRDSVRLEQVSAALKRVLSLHPARINTRLNSAVRATRIDALVEVLAYIREVCLSLRVDGTQVTKLTQGIAALNDLYHQLSHLMTDHDRWQEVDSLLRVMEECIDDDELIATWDELSPQAQLLYANSTESWAVALRQTAVQLQHAADSHNSLQLMQFFRIYRSRAMLRFWRVDKELKDLCDRLDRMDGPLAGVIGVLE